MKLLLTLFTCVFLHQLMAQRPAVPKHFSKHVEKAYSNGWDIRTIVSQEHDASDHVVKQEFEDGGYYNSEYFTHLVGDSCMNYYSRRGLIDSTKCYTKALPTIWPTYLSMKKLYTYNGFELTQVKQYRFNRYGEMFLDSIRHYSYDSESRLSSILDSSSWLTMTAILEYDEDDNVSMYERQWSDSLGNHYWKNWIKKSYTKSGELDSRISESVNAENELVYQSHRSYSYSNGFLIEMIDSGLNGIGRTDFYYESGRIDSITVSIQYDEGDEFVKSESHGYVYDQFGRLTRHRRNRHYSNSTARQLFEFEYPYWPVGVESPEGLDVSVFPNPMSEVLNVTAAMEIEGIKVLDLGGKCVFEDPIIKTERTQIDLTELPSGMYVLELALSETSEIQRRAFIKQ